MGLFASGRSRSRKADTEAPPSPSPAAQRPLPPPPKSSRMRRLLRAGLPLFVSLAMVAALEVGLRLAGFEAHVGGGGDPLLNPEPLFHPVTGADGVPMLQRNDAPVVAFRRDKPANGFRVFVVGDSSALGFPFGPEFAFSRFLQERLAAAMPERTVEVVNCAMNGSASWHARKIVDEIVQYKPDVLIVYVGHSDWITPAPETISPVIRAVSQLRFYQLAVVAGQSWQRWRQGPLDVQRINSRAEPYGQARDRARGTQTLTERDRESVTARFTDNLRAIIAAGQAVGARVVVSGLVQNLSDFPPGASRHRPDLSAADRQRWREAIDHADVRMRAQDWQGALAALQAAEQIDAHPAILHYLRGRCLQALGDYTGAAAAYQRASDLDGAPLGAPSQFDSVIRGVVEQTGVEFVDVRTALVDASPNGLVGHEFFFDYVHPSIAGHAAIGRALAAALGAAGNDDVSDPAALAAAHPELQRKVYAANVLLYLALGWYDRAIDELNEGGKQFPDLLGFREIVERFRARESVRDWDDFP